MAGAERWAEFLAAGSHTAEEFQRAWGAMREEARATWEYLGQAPSGALSATEEEVGGRNLDGSTRTKVVQQREALRHKLLTMALSRHPDREARPVTVFPNIADDKCAGSWLLATLNRDLSLSSKVFKEAFSSHLCLPSPELRDGGWVGRPVGTEGKVVDMCCKTITGDSWSKRHDAIKQRIVTEAYLA